MTVGYDGRGKRVFRRASGRTKTEAKPPLRETLGPRSSQVHGDAALSSSMPFSEYAQDRPMTIGSSSGRCYRAG